MADFKLKLQSSAPTTLNHRAIVLVGSAGDYRVYAGDSNNNAVPVTPNVADEVFTHVSINNADSPYTPNINSNTLFILADASGGAIDINLPPVADWENRTVVVKKRDTTNNTISISRDTGNIEGSASVDLSQDYQFTRLLSDASNVYIIGGDV